MNIEDFKQHLADYAAIYDERAHTAWPHEHFFRWMEDKTAEKPEQMPEPAQVMAEIAAQLSTDIEPNAAAEGEDAKPE